MNKKTKMRNIPKKIYLQVGDDGPEDIDFNELSQEDITWCQSRVDKTDIEYIRTMNEEEIKNVISDAFIKEVYGKIMEIVIHSVRKLLF